MSEIIRIGSDYEKLRQLRNLFRWLNSYLVRPFQHSALYERLLIIIIFTSRFNYLKNCPATVPVCF
jgi:hypothetical protein